MAPLATVNERTTMILTVHFYDEDGLPVTPDSASYRIDAPNEGLEILGTTEITPLDPTPDLVITSSQNACRSSAPWSERVVTVEWVYALTKRGTEEYRYKIKNLYGVDSPSPSPSPSPSA